jgi:hypothetical protein
VAAAAQGLHSVCLPACLHVCGLCLGMQVSFRSVSTQHWQLCRDMYSLTLAPAGATPALPRLGHQLVTPVSKQHWQLWYMGCVLSVCPPA